MTYDWKDYFQENYHSPLTRLLEHYQSMNWLDVTFAPFDNKQLAVYIRHNLNSEFIDSSHMRDAPRTELMHSLESIAPEDLEPRGDHRGWELFELIDLPQLVE
jgi:hypothetical protein|tara:strand:+ start:324 stop:632 length:309 start_codon:yes stop_codon:yes gene_type:complete